MGEKDKLTARMRDILIEHIDGPVPWAVKQTPDRRCGTVLALERRGLLRISDRGDDGRPVGKDSQARPSLTWITHAGRERLCEALADWADALSCVWEALADPADPPPIQPRVDRDRLLSALRGTSREVGLSP